MNCERHVPGRGHDVSGGHQCVKNARWRVTTPTGETLCVCKQHRKALENYWHGCELKVEAL